MRRVIIAVIALVTTACGLSGSAPPLDLPAWRFFKDSSGVDVRMLSQPPYTYFYALDGSLRQVGFDSDGDRRPDVIAYFSGGQTPERVQVDENRDGKADRWEEYSPTGVLLRYATSAKGGVADRFVEVDPATKAPSRIETDADLDGRRERLEVYEGGSLSRVEIDSNGDGRRDRFQVWEHGYLSREEIDRDGDGRPDLRIFHTRAGVISKVEPVSR